MTFPKDLPPGSLVTLSVNRDVQDKLDVYDGVPDVAESKVLIGKHAGTNTYTWTVNGSKALPTVVYAVGINGTDYGQVVLSLPVTIGQKTVGTARTSRPTTAPASTRP